MDTFFWNIDTEKQFFEEALKSFASPEQLFYHLSGRYFAYIPKGQSADGMTLQSRNTLIGQFTEKWCKNLFEPIANELGLSKKTRADLAFCTTNKVNQSAENIKLLFEIKMSIVSK